MKTHANRQRGVVLIELMLGLVIIAVVIGIGLLIWRATKSSADSYQTDSGFDAILGGIKTLYLSPQYALISTASIIAAEKIPAHMVSGGNQIVASWGAQIHIGPSALGGPAGSSFDITFDSVPAEQCSQLVQHGGPQVIKVLVGTTVVKDLSASPAIADPPVDTVVQACLDGGGNQIVFTST